MNDEQTTTTSEETTNSGSSETTTNETSGSSSSTTEQTNDQSQDSINLGTPAKEADDAGDTDGSGDGEGKEDGGKSEGDENAALFGAPEEGTGYQIEGLPEGMTVDEDALKAFEPIARRLNLSNDGLSLIAQTYATNVLPRAQEQIINQLNADVTARRSEWEGEARDMIAGKADAYKNAAGEPLAFDTKELSKVQQVAAKALDKLAPEGFREFLDETGLGVHPQMIAFAYQAGRQIAEDTELETADKGSRPPSRTQKYYGR